MAQLAKKGLIVFILVLALVLRVWRLDIVPPALFGDEVDVGYHAYSLATTGRDYSGNFLPLHLKSLADYKAPIYGYSIIPFVSLFGVSYLGVRLPAALFGVLGVYLFYLVIKLLFNNKSLALLSAFFLSISPWHMHYSRWGFEGVEMLTLFLGGLYCFLRAFGNGKWLVLSALLFGLTSMSYHSAKIFLPLSLLFLVLIYFKQIKAISKKYLLYSLVIFALITIPFAYASLFGGGLDRFSATSIFSDPTISGQLGASRTRDIKVRNIQSKNSEVTILDRFFHNKFTLFGSLIINNYLQVFSTEFLFIKGDPEPTHTPSGTGQFYKFQAIFLLLGFIYLLTKITDKKVKLLIVSWILIAPLPSVVTNHGGFHASRLFFLVPPLVLLISSGVYYTYTLLSKKYRLIFVLGFSIVLFISFLFYQHNYWVHYPWDSQRWWHAGFKEAIQFTVSEGKKFDKVIISGADEPPLIFFLGWSMYPPSSFQQKYPLVKENLEGFGAAFKLDKYYFTPIGEERGLYELGKVLPTNTLYLATAKEIKVDLIVEPGRMPSDLILIKSFAYPSGDPAFYLFTKNEKNKTT